MSRLFIIGAGFSKALAGLPLGNELASLIYQRAKMTPSKNIRLRGIADCFIRVWAHLQKQAGPLLDYLQEDGTKIETLEDGTHPIDIEYMLSLIDLNLNSPHIPKGIGIDLQGCPVPYLEGISGAVLEHARLFALHQIAEIMQPKNYSDVDSHRLQKVIGLVEPGDSVVTFNYDLIIDQGLYSRKLWYPPNGYVIGTLCEKEKLKEAIGENVIDFIKLHGSINWTKEGLIIPSADVTIHLADPYDDSPYFEGMGIESVHPEYKAKYPREPLLILPTFLKLFDKPYEIDLVKKSLELARTAEHIFIIGYSLPREDIVANLIMSQISKEAMIYIVNRSSASTLMKRLTESFSIEPGHIVAENSDIVTWIDNDFEYKQYQIDQENQAYMQSMIDVANAGGPVIE